MAEPLRVTVRPTPFVPVSSAGGAGDPTGGFERIEPAAMGAQQAPAPAAASADTGGFERVDPAQAAATGGFERVEEAPKSTFSDMLKKAIEPVTSYPETQSGMARESFEQMGRGVEQLGDNEKLKGAANIGLGALGYTLSPVNAALRTVVGKPVEENTGIPKEYTEFATSLALPGLGFAKTPQWMQKLVSPETVAPEAMEAAALIRGRTGAAARDTETTAAQLEPWQKQVNQLAPADQLNIMHYVEGGGTVPGNPSLRALADTLKDAFELRKQKLMALPQHAQMNFVDDYFPHFWTDPNAAQNAVRGGMGKQGSGASLHARSVPTIADGIAAGLTPLTTNPIEATMRYITSMDKFVASQEMLNAGKQTGAIIYRRPSAMGASGHPQSVAIPPGYAKLEGRGSTNAVGEQAFAPENWARVYNNFISRGFDQIGGGEYGQVYMAVQRAFNAITQAVLSFSGYHAFTMAEATMSNQMAKAIREMRNLSVTGAVRELGKLAVAPISYAIRGKTWKEMYLGKRMPMNPQDREILDLITEAGGRMAGTKHAIDYHTSALGDYFTAYQRGNLRAQLLAQGADIKAHPIMGTFRTVASNIGRLMDSFNRPIFQHYIPSVKNAAAAENMGQWLKMNPNATQAEKLTAARQVVDSVDNRFGEMIHDNIFWNKVAKQTAMLASLSYSWNMGAIREIGGGVRDMARTAVGKNRWTAKADYVVGMTINWAIMSAVYQGLKTGEAPKDVHDLAAPRTGGIDARTGEPERIIPPGPMKDVFGYYNHFGQEVLNKMNPGLRLAGQSLSILGGQGGSDWRGDPILSPPDEGQGMGEKMPDWLAEYFNFVIKGMSPIQSQQLGRGPEEGSALSPLELGLGIRTAPRQLVDPEGQESMHLRMWQNRWFGRRGRGGKLGHDAAEQQRYGGPQ